MGLGTASGWTLKDNPEGGKLARGLIGGFFT